MKKITSLTLGISFLVMTYTGIMLFFCPQGKIAYWSDWTLLGLNKTQYGDLHTTSLFVMVSASILHIYYNWKPLVSYLKDKTHKISFTKKEFLIALGINLAFVIGTLAMVQPFKGIIDINTGIKEYWELKYGSPPYGHAEESSLKTFCRKVGINLMQAKSILVKNGIKFNENESMESIAKNNGISPNDIYMMIKPKSIKKAEEETKTDGVPAKLGRRTLKELSDLGRVDLQKSLEIIKSKGYQAVTAESRMKNIADELGTTPYDLFEMIKKR